MKRLVTKQKLLTGSLVVLVGALGAWKYEVLSYIAVAGVEHIKLMMNRQSIRELMNDPNTSPGLRERLQLVLRLRDFAVGSLELPDNASYTTYVNLDREDIAWNVFAAAELSTNPLEWCFPIAGCVVYRGYFSKDRAMEFANRLRSDGNDSYVARVTAYSTLGWFDDPVLSSFIQRPPEDLTAVIFHELAHQKLYVAGDSAFSEGFAVAVERESVRRWLESTGQFEVLQDVTAKWRVTDLEVRQILATQKELERIYTSGQSQEEMKNRKRSIMRQLQDTLCGIDRSCEDRTLPRAAAGDLVEINNAYLVAVDTYYSKVPAFEELLRRVHYNLPEFYRSVKEIAELPMTGREQHLRSLIQEKRDERE